MFRVLGLVVRSGVRNTHTHRERKKERKKKKQRVLFFGEEERANPLEGTRPRSRGR